jgi:hypothetical protein
MKSCEAVSSVPESSAKLSRFHLSQSTLVSSLQRIDEGFAEPSSLDMLRASTSGTGWGCVEKDDLASRDDWNEDLKERARG